MKMMAFYATTALVALAASTAMADVRAAKSLTDGSSTTITGTVEKVDNEHEFTLRDSSGRISVNQLSSNPVQLKEGDTVSASGQIDKGIFTSKLDAGRIDITSSTQTQPGAGMNQSSNQPSGMSMSQKNASSSMNSSAAMQHDGNGVSASAEASTTYRTSTVKALPDEGNVQVSGVVDSTDGNSKFTLKDQTGKIDVEVKPGDAVAVAEGNEVLVIGSVNSGMLGKNLAATRVIVKADSNAAQQQPASGGNQGMVTQ